MALVPRNPSEFDEKGCCKHCLKGFDDKSGFLRHVSRTKSCLMSYDQDYIDSVRKECRRESRLRHYHEVANGANKELYKAERKKQRELNPKSYYMSKRIRHSPKGHQFEKVFRTVFQTYMTDAEGVRLKNLAEDSKTIHEDAFDVAMDTIFSDPLAHVLNSTALNEGAKDNLLFFDEETILEATFIRMEEKFNKKWKELHAEYKDNWVTFRIEDLRHNFYPFASNKVFVEFYNEEDMEEKYQNATDIALDKVFLTLIVTEGYFPDDIEMEGPFSIESKLFETFERIWREELFRLIEDSELKGKMSTLMEKMLEKKFSSMNLIY